MDIEIQYLRKENKELVEKINALANENYKYKRILEDIKDNAHRIRTFGNAEDIFVGLTEIIELIKSNVWGIHERNYNKN